MMGEFDAQAKLFKERVKNPDRVIPAKSVMHGKYEDGERWWFITDDNEVIMVYTTEGSGL